MYTFIPPFLLILVSLTAGAGAQHHVLSLALLGGRPHTLQPAAHDADIDILGFTADITVRERYPLDSTARGRLLLVFAGSQRRELVTCTIALDDGPTEPATIADGTGLSLSPGPVVDGHRGAVIELRFLELLPRSGGCYRLTYLPPVCAQPGDAGPTPASTDPPWVSISLAAAMPIGDIACLSHEARIWSDGARSARVLPDLRSRDDGSPVVLRYALDGEELVHDMDIFEAPDGELLFMAVSPPDDSIDAPRP